MRIRGGWILSGVLAAGLLGAARPARADDFLSTLLRLGLSHEAGWEARRLTNEGGPEAISAATAYRVGMALALDGRPDEAAPFLIDAAAAAEDPRRADEWELAAGVVLLRAHAVPQALHLFARVEDLGATDRTRALGGRLRCVAEVLGGEPAAARACVTALLPGRASDREVRALLDGLDVDPHRRAIAGGVLSAILPGLGQLTAGRPGDALLALLVDGGLGVAVGFLLADGAVADASLVGLGVGLRYYLGNIQHGAAAWRAAAEQRRAWAAERLIRLLGRNDSSRPR